MNSRVIGPAVAGVLTLGVLGGAAIAQVTADKPVKPVYVAPAALTCPASPEAVSPGPDPTGTATLVPPLATSGQICNYHSGTPVVTKLGAREAAAIIAGLNAGHPNPTTAAAPFDTGTDALCVAADGPWLVQLRYGTREDVAVVVKNLCAAGLRAFNGIAVSAVTETALVPAPASTEEPVVVGEDAEGAEAGEGAEHSG